MLNRPRRNRKHSAIREMVEETVLRPSNLIYPLFLSNSNEESVAIDSLPDLFRLNLNGVLKEIEQCVQLGLKTFVIFPVIPEEYKDKTGTYSYAEDNFYLTGIRKIKEQFPGIILMSDVALDPYNIDGHDGIVRNGEILNDETLPVLGKMSVAQAQAGIDIIGPSDMMDGRVGYIREQLDNNCFEHVSIMSYTAKYASAFYGPFRDALDSAPKAGDKKTYQMNPANKKEALREAELDEAEGADFLMVKPALAYLDIIHVLKESSMLPIAAYNVSGEYAMLKAACANGWLEYEKAMPEMLLSMKRAGADSILTYFAKDFADLYKKQF
jgi:porphobilinogen synthase